VDTDGHYANPNLLDRYLMQPSILRAFGWRFALVLTKDWYHNPEDVLARLERALQGQEAEEEAKPEEEEPAQTVTPTPFEVAAPVASAPPTPAQAPAAAETAISKEATPPPIPASADGQDRVRHFEFVGGSSRKFWEVSVSGNSFTVRFGRVGTTGQSQTKSFADEAKAKHEADHLISEKLRKGYVEKDCV
jgi:predicted DNA-binding WGR domain protein